MVMEFMNSIGRKNNFKDGKPGKKVDKEIPSAISWAHIKKTRSSWSKSSQEVIDKFFDTVLIPILTEHKLTDRPASILNADESGFNTNPIGEKVLVESGSNSKTGSQLTPNLVKKMASAQPRWDDGGNYGWTDGTKYQDRRNESINISAFAVENLRCHIVPFFTCFYGTTM